MAIYKRCSKCHQRIPSGTTCNCLKQRHKEYDKLYRDKKSDAFYHSKEWKIVRADVIRFCNEIDLYSYYVLKKIEKAQIVHHIEPLKEQWAKRLDKLNLIPLTESNHQIIHNNMKNGKREETIKLLQKLVILYKNQAIG